jgi:hypothetical protein
VSQNSPSKLAVWSFCAQSTVPPLRLSIKKVIKSILFCNELLKKSLGERESSKAELSQVGILFGTQFSSLGIFINKKVGF